MIWPALDIGLIAEADRELIVGRLPKTFPLETHRADGQPAEDQCP